MGTGDCGTHACAKTCRPERDATRRSKKKRTVECALYRVVSTCVVATMSMFFVLYVIGGGVHAGEHVARPIVVLVLAQLGQRARSVRLHKGIGLTLVGQSGRNARLVLPPQLLS